MIIEFEPNGHDLVKCKKLNRITTVVETHHLVIELKKNRKVHVWLLMNMKVNMLEWFISCILKELMLKG
jgi:hypothetical protein